MPEADIPLLETTMGQLRPVWRGEREELQKSVIDPVKHLVWCPLGRNPRQWDQWHRSRSQITMEVVDPVFHAHLVHFSVTVTGIQTSADRPLAVVRNPAPVGFPVDETRSLAIDAPPRVRHATTPVS